MRKLLLLFLTGFLSALSSIGQVITDNRVIVSNGATDSDIGITSAACQGDKMYIACTDKRLRRNGYPAITRLNSNGDTVWFKTLSADPGFSTLCVKRDRIYLFNLSRFSVGPNFDLPGMDFFVFDTLGNQLRRTLLLQDSAMAPDPGFGDAIWISDSVLLIAGYRTAFGSPLRGWMMAVSTTGRIVWQRYYQPVPGVLAEFTDMELVQGNLIRACVNIGRNVWISYFNAADGSLVSERNLYTNPFPYTLSGAYARPAPGNRWVISAKSPASGGRDDYRLIVTDDTGRVLATRPTPSWLARPAVSSDGHVFYDLMRRRSSRSPLEVYTYKLSIDNLDSVWRADHVASYPVPALREFVKQSNRYYFDGRGGLRSVGDGSYGGFYTARISNAGYEYQDPEAVTATQERVAVKPYPVPNPAGGSVSFAGFQGRGELSLVGVDGRIWLTRRVTVGEHVDLAMLPAGLFVYRLTVSAKTYTGRVVHERP